MLILSSYLFINNDINGKYELNQKYRICVLKRMFYSHIITVLILVWISLSINKTLREKHLFSCKRVSKN